LSNMPTYQGRIEDLDPQGGKIFLGGLSITALARLVSQGLDGPLSGKTLLILTPTAMEAEDLASDLHFFRPEARVFLFPAADSKPFLNLSVNSSAAADRLLALYHLLDPQRPAIVAGSIMAAMRLVPNPADLQKSAFLLKAGKETIYEDLAGFLPAAGYVPVTQVDGAGDYSLRGGLLDIFPAGFKMPVRAEFFGDFVESIRTFRVDDQRSVRAEEEVLLLPGTEVRLNQENGRRAAEDLEKLALSQNWLNLLWEPIAERFRNNILFDDLNSWVPLFHGARSCLSACLGSRTQAVLYEPQRIAEKGADYLLSLRNHFERLKSEERPHLPLETLFQAPEAVVEKIRSRTVWESRFADYEPRLLEKDPRIFTVPLEYHLNLAMPADSSRRAPGLMGPLAARIRALLGRGFKVKVVLRSQEQSRRLAELLAEYDLSPEKSLSGRLGKGELLFEVGLISGGFAVLYDREAWIAEDEIFGPRTRARRRAGEEIRLLRGGASLRDLAPNDFVVHTEHGIAQYLGLVSMTTSFGHKGDFLHLGYWGGDSLYVPVERFASVTKYIGSSDHPPKMDRLGDQSWDKVKQKVKEELRQTADELLKLYAARQASPGFAFSPRDSSMAEFEESFQFVETPDQQKAIEEVLADLQEPRPMDRLICGDVGFGKTEVAMRAAFRAVLDQKQVAILVPTTILAEQHERSLKERLKDWPVNITSLSRFKKPSEQKRILREAAEGKIDILVGTHRILQTDVAFKALGLVVIDEEHRFGVEDKERLKKLRLEVDVLAMSATPIPRSLSMSMNGIRDMSVIETPPNDRLAVKTSLIRCEDESICEAIDRELARQGQVFFIHNRVMDIQMWVRRLQRLMPLVRFGVGHGQMKAAELEEVMRSFLNREIDVWIATSIVESGLDFPEANTIIIDRADRFGLAQLYQLRGRVGRSGTQAYCYLMVDNPETLTMDAKKRLRALLDYSELGSGYQIALHDLQIRGSGSILGTA
ncbi:MAG: transcription-repair coupling factor, partial [Deltaproteobacteria bacterium]|nr:transcription-repair coupling factor [Deltaproteobacteria bacterium]